MRGQTRVLIGSPGTLVEKVTDQSTQRYVYRVFYERPGIRKEQYICKATDTTAVDSAKDAIDMAKSIAEAVGQLKKLGFLVFDKAMGRLLVDLFNAGFLGHEPNTMVLFGELAEAVIKNELGLKQKPRKLAHLEFAVQRGVDFIALSGVIKKHSGLNVRLYVGKGTSSFPADLEIQVLHSLDEYFANALPAVCMAGWNAIPCLIPQPEILGSVDD